MLIFVFNLPATFAASYKQIPAFEISTISEKFYRTELYFGMNKPGGVVITNEEWSKFLEDEVTPRFPDGFTVLEGYGQFKNKSGKIVKEGSKVLIVLYPKKAFADADRKIDEIRTAYNKAFQQQSVLRMDIVQTVRVSF
ncbi:MAG TPA: DUF3574 domain-containing protein [Pyrinomonadaceae bacterium]|nr:DUF3574 domain-containing protein [Pyrinomonadaceae bacterium]